MCSQQWISCQRCNDRAIYHRRGSSKTRSCDPSECVSASYFCSIGVPRSIWAIRTQWTVDECQSWIIIVRKRRPCLRFGSSNLSISGVFGLRLERTEVTWGVTPEVAPRAVWESLPSFKPWGQDTILPEYQGSTVVIVVWECDIVRSKR